ncbi:MAG: CvpA family protein [Chloroflexi bacterium]|nr:CvpA family protein [Chloroflexota bacterium]
MSGREAMSTLGLHGLQISPQGVLEILFLAAIVFAVWTGFQSGFVAQVASLLRLLVSFLAASRFFPQLSLIIQQIFTLPPVVGNILSFLTILLFVLLIMTWVYHLILRPLIGLLHITPGLGLLDRILGAFLAIVQELFWVAALLTVILLLPIHSVWQDAITRSPWANALVVSLSSVEQQLQQRLGSLQVPLIPNQGALNLPARDTERTLTMHFPRGLHLQEDREAERTMYVFVNQQRTARGLPPLVLDPRLSALALAHSVDMFQRSYFGHVTPASSKQTFRVALPLPSALVSTPVPSSTAPAPNASSVPSASAARKASRTGRSSRARSAASMLGTPRPPSSRASPDQRPLSSSRSTEKSRKTWQR